MLHNLVFPAPKGDKIILLLSFFIMLALTNNSLNDSLQNLNVFLTDIIIDQYLMVWNNTE